MANEQAAARGPGGFVRLPISDGAAAYGWFRTTGVAGRPTL